MYNFHILIILYVLFVVMYLRTSQYLYVKSMIRSMQQIFLQNLKTKISFESCIPPQKMSCGPRFQRRFVFSFCNFQNF